MENPFWHIILNPAANHGLARAKWPKIESILQEMGFAYSLYETQARGDATRIAEKIILDGGRYILGIGGDGTNHEIINGILGQAAVPSATLHYALLPLGTGNDWARMYGIPTDVRTRLARLKRLETVCQDAGIVHYSSACEQRSRFFVNVAGMAYDGFIGQKLTTNPARNKMHYLFRVLQHLMEYKLRKAVIHFDGQRVEDYFYTINIGLCKYSGGGMQLVPQAISDDGLFGLTFARSLSKLEVLLQTPRFYKGTILQHPQVEGFQVKSLRVEHSSGELPTLLEADGEFLGESPASFEILEAALTIVL
jgi:diacylglycerol kinase (ATP)